MSNILLIIVLFIWSFVDEVVRNSREWYFIQVAIHCWWKETFDKEHRRNASGHAQIILLEKVYVAKLGCKQCGLINIKVKITIYKLNYVNIDFVTVSAFKRWLILLCFLLRNYARIRDFRGVTNGSGQEQRVRAMQTTRHSKNTYDSLRPEADGLSERLNRTIIQMSKTYINGEHDDWDEFMPQPVIFIQQQRPRDNRLHPLSKWCSYENRSCRSI